VVEIIIIEFKIMKSKIYQVDAFAKEVFTGNPAAVCPLEEWPSDGSLQKIAAENYVPETAFYVKKESHYEIRWFSPEAEVALCGHATLAAAFVLFNYQNYDKDIIEFHSRKSGKLTVSRSEELLTLNFPTDKYEEIPLTEEILKAFNFSPIKAYKGKTDHMLVFDNEEQIKNIIPDLEIIASLGGRGTIVTAKGNDTDFVSRFFAPQIGINEDPVTGSAHTTLMPYWYKELGKDELTAVQLSERKGYLQCKYMGDRVEISGQCMLYMTGEIYL